MLDKIKAIKNTREQMKIAKGFISILKESNSFEEFHTNYRAFIFDLAKTQLLKEESEEDLYNQIDDALQRSKESLKTMFRLRHMLDKDKEEKENGK